MLAILYSSAITATTVTIQKVEVVVNSILNKRKQSGFAHLYKKANYRRSIKNVYMYSLHVFLKQIAIRKY